MSETSDSVGVPTPCSFDFGERLSSPGSVENDIMERRSEMDIPVVFRFLLPRYSSKYCIVNLPLEFVKAELQIAENRIPRLVWIQNRDNMFCGTRLQMVSLVVLYFIDRFSFSDVFLSPLKRSPLQFNFYYEVEREYRKRYGCPNLIHDVVRQLERLHLVGTREHSINGISATFVTVLT
jgi:hypothetical protein